MKVGHTFLVDEISLAEDSVLELLNSVLEPERTLLLAEKGSSRNSASDQITAHQNFRLVATMNPGGDYGKKEVMCVLKNIFVVLYVYCYVRIFGVFTCKNNSR